VESTRKQITDKAWRKRNAGILKAKSLEYYHIMHYNDEWRLAYNKRLRLYKRALLKDPVKKEQYNTYLRNKMREYGNITPDRWLVA